MPKDYREVVFEAYEKRKLEGKLSSNLLDATPGNLREECLIVCRERYIPQDHEILRLFFSNGDKEKGYLNILENTAAETFKQMSNVLKGGVKKPGIKYVELLAWLMDFNPKTSTAYYKSFYEVTNAGVIEENQGLSYINGEVEEIFSNSDEAIEPEKKETDLSALNQPQEIIGKSEDKPNAPAIGALHNHEAKADTANENVQDTPRINTLDNNQHNMITAPNSSWKQSLSIRITIVFGIIILIAGVATFQFWQDKKDRATITKDEKCMYWTGNHYEAIACNLETSHVKLPLVLSTLKHLKKITEPDTLTKSAIGRTWYGKTNQQIAFYTIAGTNPLDTNKRLLPVSNYILSKYVSYPRYQLKLLVWSIAGVLMITFLVICSYYWLKKHRSRKPVYKQKTSLVTARDLQYQ